MTVKAIVPALCLVWLCADPVLARPVSLIAYLAGGDEIPAVATGSFGFVAIDVETDTGEVSYQMRIFNLPSGLTGAQIHAGSPGVNGPVILTLSPGQGQSNDFDLVGK